MHVVIRACQKWLSDIVDRGGNHDACIRYHARQCPRPFQMPRGWPLMLARLRIGPKLLLAPGVVLVLLVVLSCGAYLAMLRQNDSLDTIVQQRANHMQAASSLV